MFGLLGDLDDPKRQALLMASLRLLGGGRKGEVGKDIMEAGLLGLQGYQGAKQGLLQQQERTQEQELRRMQMDQMRAAMAQREQEQARQQQMRSLPQQFQMPGNAVQNDDQGFALPAAPQGLNREGYASALEGLDPQAGLQYRAQLAQMQPKTPAPMKVAPGETLYDVAGQKPIYSAPDRPKDWQDPAYIAAQKEIRAAGRPQVTTNVMPPREIFKDSMALKKDFDSQPEVKGFKEVQGAWDQISTALSDPSAANDLAAATKFMKLLDPGSVVRESELAMAMQASGALDRFMNLGQRIAKGHKLTPAQRVEFRSAGEALYNASKQRFGETVNQYQGIAGQYGLDPQFIPKETKPEEKKTIKMGGKPVEAKKAPDGNYYIKSGDKWYRVEE